MKHDQNEFKIEAVLALKESTYIYIYILLKPMKFSSGLPNLNQPLTAHPSMGSHSLTI